MELLHHGIKGQKWGVRNGPPYPLVKVSKKKSAKESNEIYNSLSIDEKKKFMGYNAKQYVSQKEYDKDKVEHFLLKHKDIPVAVLDIWGNERNDEHEMMIAVRPEYRRKGYAKKLTKIGMDWVEKNGIKNLYAGIRSDNVGSKAIAKAVGFERDLSNTMYEPKGWETYKYKGNNK